MLLLAQGSSQAWALLALVHKNSAAACAPLEGREDDFQLCVVELKHRDRKGRKAHARVQRAQRQRQRQQERQQERERAEGHDRMSVMGDEMSEGAAAGGAQAQGPSGEAEADAEGATAARESGSRASHASHASRASHAGDLDVVCEPPASCAGVLGVWQLLLDLGLRGLAEQVRGGWEGRA